MKKFIIFLMVTMLAFIVTGCDSSTTNNELPQENQNVQSANDSSRAIEVRHCAECGRAISKASKYDYCDGCRCGKMEGCPMPKKDRMGKYCITHECFEDGCTSARTSGSNYCVRHE